MNEKENTRSIGDGVFNALGLKDVGTGLDLADMLSSLAKVVTPQALIRENINFTSEMVKIMLGMSEIEPQKKDKRFADTAWKDNPLYKRIGQSYLAWSKGVENLIPDDIDWPEEERARFAVNILVRTAISSIIDTARCTDTVTRIVGIDMNHVDQFTRKWLPRNRPGAVVDSRSGYGLVWARWHITVGHVDRKVDSGSIAGLKKQTTAETGGFTASHVGARTGQQNQHVLR